MTTNDKTLNELFSMTKTLVHLYDAMSDACFEYEMVELAKDQLAENKKLADLANLVNEWEQTDDQKAFLISIAKRSGYSDLENDLVEIIGSKVTLGIDQTTGEPKGTLMVDFKYTADDGFDYESEVFITSLTHLEF